jgi:hypothetical protein
MLLVLILRPLIQSLCCYYCATPTTIQSLFVHNKAVSASGGAILIGSTDSALIISRTEFIGNIALNASAGAIDVTGGVLTLSQVHIVHTLAHYRVHCCNELYYYYMR